MIVVVDYNAGNTRSVLNCLDRIEADYRLTDNADLISGADKVIFPGVGHAAHAMSALREKGLVNTLRNLRNPILGICVGMQLLFDYSEEGDTDMLGVIAGKVKRFSGENLIIPHVGWSKHTLKKERIFDSLPSSEWFYSVHSYRVEVNEYAIATCDYGSIFASAVKKDNYYGVQFHPEKSSAAGQQIIRNFLKL